MARTEHQIEKEVCEYAATQNVKAEKLERIGGRGWPDRTLFYFGRVYFVEFKDPYGSLSPQQIATIADLGKMGFGVAVIDSVADGVKFVDSIVWSGDK